MIELNTIQQDIATLPPEAQQIVFDLVGILKKRYLPPQQETTSDWSDFIGCIEAEPDLSVNYKTYLANELNQKYSNH